MRDRLYLSIRDKLDVKMSRESGYERRSFIEVQGSLPSGGYVG